MFIELALSQLVTSRTCIYKLSSNLLIFRVSAMAIGSCGNKTVKAGPVAAVPPGKKKKIKGSDTEIDFESLDRMIQTKEASAKLILLTLFSHSHSSLVILTVTKRHS